MKRKIISTLICCFLSIPTIFCAEIPQLKFVKIIGDMRGKGVSIACTSVAVADNGVIYLLMDGGRVAVFDREGKYQKNLRVDASAWGGPNTPYLATAGNRVLVGLYQKDYPWVYAPERKGNSEGKFSEPTMVAVDEPGNIYVADTGNARIQIFSPDNTQIPKEIVKPPAAPYRLAARNNRLAVHCADQNLILYEKMEKGFTQKEILQIGPAVRSLSLGPGSVFTAFIGGYQGLKKYGIKDGCLKELAVIAAPHTDQWPNFFPAGVPISSGPDGRLWFAACQECKLLSLDPNNDVIKETLAPLPLPMTVAFGSQGQMYVGGYYDPKEQGLVAVIPSAKSDQPGVMEIFPKKGLFGPEQGACLGLLPDAAGGVFMRVIEEGYQKGWPALTFKKVFPDGTMKLFADFGSLYAVRRRFTAAPYTLQFDKDKNIILAALPLVAVLKLSPDGKTIWEAGIQPKGGADKIEFSGPTDVALDRKGNIWVTDGEQNKVFCLSPAGKLLFEYGGYANVDDVEGKGFDCPTGIETALVNGEEFLYVGDAGNLRIVKYRIMYQ